MHTNRYWNFSSPIVSPEDDLSGKVVCHNTFTTHRSIYTHVHIYNTAFNIPINVRRYWHSQSTVRSASTPCWYPWKWHFLVSAHIIGASELDRGGEKTTMSFTFVRKNRFHETSGNSQNPIRRKPDLSRCSKFSHPTNQIRPHSKTYIKEKRIKTNRITWQIILYR